MDQLPLLTTKLQPSQGRPRWVHRSRLVQRLADGLNQGRRLTLVSAPAGFGKSTLLLDWIQGQAGSRSAAGDTALPDVA